MSRSVPNWDLDDGDDRPRLSSDFSSDDCEVAELTWENGQLSLHGLGQSRPSSKPAAAPGTLESLMDQAAPVNKAAPIGGCKPSFACGAELVPWLDPSQDPRDVVAAGSGNMVMDALVPSAAARDDPRRQAMWLLANSAAHGTGACGCCSAHVGSCSRVEWADHRSVRELENTTSEGSPENTATGSGDGNEERAAPATTEEHDSVYSRPQKGAEESKRRIGKSSPPTKRSRAAAVHNQSERKRRDKINQRMKTLQKLVPNSSKTDKASVLDEVIDYLKQLQAQVQLMSRTSMMQMMLPLALQLQLHLSMMASPMGLGLGLSGMPGVIPGDMSALGAAGHPSIPGIPPLPAIHPYSPFMPTASWDGARFAQTVSVPTPAMPDQIYASAFLASQSTPTNYQMQAMTADAYTRLAAMYQQQQQHRPPTNPNN